MLRTIEPNVKHEPQVSEAVKRLLGEIERIDQNTKDLEAKLTPVARPTAPEVSNPSEKMQLVPLAETLNDLALRLSVIAGNMDSLIGRIEL